MRHTTMNEALDQIIRDALDRKATDIFLIRGEPVAWRIDNQIVRAEGDVIQDLDFMIEAIVGDPERLKKIASQTGEVHEIMSLDGVRDFRFSIASTRGAHSMTIQLACPQVVDVEQLRVPQAVLDIALELKGLVVFSGLVGSGKSTTAYSVVDYINRRMPCHICTVEDPMFARLRAKRAIVQQREVGDDVPDVLAGFRAASAQDYDVLFLNEMKSVEELEACIAAAETGHLVITVMNLQASPEDIVRRMSEAFPEQQRVAARRALAKVLKVVCSQILLPAKSGGHVAAYSILVPDEEMRDAIAEGRDIRGHRPAEYVGMTESVQTLEAKGLITKQTADLALKESR